MNNYEVAISGVKIVAKILNKPETRISLDNEAFFNIEV
jgi:hypothetical protein